MPKSSLPWCTEPIIAYLCLIYRLGQFKNRQKKTITTKNALVSLEVCERQDEKVTDPLPENLEDSSVVTPE